MEYFLSIFILITFNYRLAQALGPDYRNLIKAKAFLILASLCKGKAHTFPWE